MNKLFLLMINAAVANTDVDAFIKDSERVSKAAESTAKEALKTLEIKPDDKVDAQAAIAQAHKLEMAVKTSVKKDIDRYFSGRLNSGKGCGQSDQRCAKKPFEKSLQKSVEKPQKKSCGQAAPAENAAKDAPLVIFVSSSMPKESLRSLYQEAAKIGARLVFRGLINDSFKHTQTFFQEAQIVADIDPTQFEEHQIVQVPTFILSDANTHDRLQGHISLTEALTQFHDKGQLKGQAKQLLQQLKSRRS